jgi:hypothetical protein
VSIREYYVDANGNELPGKKGITLNVDQWEHLKSYVRALTFIVFVVAVFFKSIVLPSLSQVAQIDHALKELC